MSEEQLTQKILYHMGETNATLKALDGKIEKNMQETIRLLENHDSKITENKDNITSVQKEVIELQAYKNKTLGAVAIISMIVGSIISIIINAIISAYKNI